MVWNNTLLAGYPVPEKCSAHREVVDLSTRCLECSIEDPILARVPVPE